MYKKVDINKKNVPYLYYFLIHNLKTLVCGFSIRCMRILLPWAFLSYKPNVYEFLYNLSCQLSETVVNRHGAGFNGRKIVFVVL